MDYSCRVSNGVILMEKIGIVVKPGSSIALNIARRIAKTLIDQGVMPMVEEGSARSYTELSDYKVFTLQDPPSKIIVVGGDGTLLRTVMLLGRPDSVIMTVRAGKRGFLLDVEPYEVEDRVRDFVHDNYKLIHYSRLKVKAPDNVEYCVLNDSVFITKKAKLVSLSININGERAMNLDGDGVVISTTAGSTAYSLSAGGPIIDPGLDVVVITPLNPVQLHLRPLVVRFDSKIEVEISQSSNNLYLVLDGQESVELLPGDLVSIEHCPYPALIARFKWWENYYEKLYSRIYSYI